MVFGISILIQSRREQLLYVKQQGFKHFLMITILIVVKQTHLK